MKPYQFFKICKRFDKEREKTLMQPSIRNEKLRKVGLLFYNRLFYKCFNMIIDDFFCFASSFAAQFLFFDIRMTQKILKGEVGNGKQLGMVNYNIYFKYNFNRLVMNLTQTNFFADKMCIYDAYLKLIIKEVCIRSSAHIKNTLIQI